MSVVSRCTSIFLTLAVASCAEPASDRSSTRTQSTIIVDRRLAAETSWIPSVRIGLAEGPAEYLFFRASDGFRTEAGELYVANSGTGEIRVYSDTGQFLYAFGQMGEGPGEFRNLRSIGVADDGSVLALDAQGGRISVFDEAGAYRRSFSVALDDAHQEPSRMWVGPASEVFVTVTSGLDPRQMSVARDSLRVLRVDTERPDPEVLFLVGDMWWESSAGARGYRLRAAAAGPVAAITSRGGTFATSSNDRPAIEIRDARGGLLATWEDPHHARGEPSGDGDVESLEEANQRGRFYAQLRWGASGDHLWIGDAGLPNDATRIWTIVDRDGHPVGKTSLPMAANLWQVGRDFLLLKTVDDFGVERVEVWRPDP